MKKKHHGHATKSVKPKMHGDGHGSNLTLKHPEHSIHVAPQKDRMAGNVGGNAHMEPDAKSLGHQELYETGGAMKGPKKAHEKY